MLVNRFCPNCGEAIQFDDTRDFMFCQFCGGKIPNASKQQSAIQQTTTNNAVSQNADNSNGPNLYISFKSNNPGVRMVTRIVSTGEKSIYSDGQTLSFKLAKGPQTIVLKIGKINYNRDIVISDNSSVLIKASFDGRAHIDIDQSGSMSVPTVAVIGAQPNNQPSRVQPQNTQPVANNHPLTNCPSCGAPIDSFAAKCQFCGLELNHKIHASACQELCNRLDEIEASRPRENLFSFVSGLANKALDTQKMSQTDQKKIELISNFIIPNTRAELLEFIFLAQARMKGCQDISKSSEDEYVSFVQGELKNIWDAKLEQAFAKGHIVLANDSEFLNLEREYKMRKNQEKGLCRHCGGKFKGLITKTCINCGKPKDY